ncbi:MAG: hypothetical protein ACK4UO_06220 [Pseudolabrys sp.]
MLGVLGRAGVWLRAGLEGVPVGLQLREALASLPGGLDRDLCRRLLIIAEPAFLAALYRKRKDKTDG